MARSTFEKVLEDQHAARAEKWGIATNLLKNAGCAGDDLAGSLTQAKELLCIAVARERARQYRQSRAEALQKCNRIAERRVMRFQMLERSLEPPHSSPPMYSMRAHAASW